MRTPKNQSAVYLLRHGETDWNAQGRFQGHTDTPLNARGVAQASAAIAPLRGRGIRQVVSSDLTRARHTAIIVAASLGLPVEVDPELRERRYGVFEGLTWAQIAAQHPVHHAGWQRDPNHAVPNAEPVDVLRARAWRAFERHARHAQGEDAVLLVSHGGLLRSMLWHVLGEDAPKPIENARPYRVTLEDGRVVAVDVLPHAG